MAAVLVQLPNPHGRRYAPAEKECAYQTWRFAAGRSRRKTAELTGISAGTIDNWHRDDGWAARARREDNDDAKLLHEALRGIKCAEALKSIETAAKLRDDESGTTPPKVRLDAAVWLAGIAGVSPVKQSLDLTRPDADDRPAPDMSIEAIERRRAERMAAFKRDREAEPRTSPYPHPGARTAVSGGGDSAGVRAGR